MKLVLITGATKGIGRSTAFDFANAGWDLILLARDLKLLETIKSELSTTKSKVYLIKCDLSDSKTIDACLSEVITQIGCPSVVINNAGFAYNGDLVGMPLINWETIMQVNLTSVFQICSFLVPYMRQKGGLIINVSSHAANNSFPQWGAYCVSKAALASFTRCLREEERKNSIRTCTITLGSVNTPLWESEFVNSDFNKDAMLSSSQVSKTILFIAEQPRSQIIEDLVLMPSAGAF